MRPSDPAQQSVHFHDAEFSFDEIHQVVESFYYKVEHDPLLKVPFQSVHDWPEHVNRLTHFWWLRFGGKAYMQAQYSPVSKHFTAGFNEVFLKRWLELFHETMRENLNPNQCEVWTLLSERMGQGLLMRNEMYRKAHSDAQQRLSSVGEKSDDQNS